MRRSPELIVLIVLLFASIAAVSWYVIDRRARMHAAATTRPPAPAAAAAGSVRPAPPVPGVSPAVAPPVDLAAHDRQTIDFSSGQPVVKTDAAEQASIDAAEKEIRAAQASVDFREPAKKKP